MHSNFSEMCCIRLHAGPLCSFSLKVWWYSGSFISSESQVYYMQHQAQVSILITINQVYQLSVFVSYMILYDFHSIYLKLDFQTTSKLNIITLQYNKNYALGRVGTSEIQDPWVNPELRILSGWSLSLCSAHVRVSFL